MKKVKAPKTVKDIREQLCDMFVGLQDGSIDLKEAKNAANLAGKVIASLRVQLEYAKLRGKAPLITFLNCR